MADPEVLIVGAGPTGLAMATELARFGVSYRLIERAAQPTQWSQALVVQARTLEQFERYGIADIAVERGCKIHEATIFSDHKPIVQLSFDKIHSRYPYLLFLPQSETERLLIEHLDNVGGRIERQVELESFRHVDDAVEATLRREDGQTEQARASWMVGCDGAHSLVRRQLGVPFKGDAVDFIFFLGDMRITGQETPDDELRVYLHEGNVVFIARLTESVYRIIVALHDQQPQEAGSNVPAEPEVTLADFQRAVDAHADAGMILSDPTWMTPFRINQRKAAYYRVGHVFLAGDASHIHSPVGGQGMNTGIQDAANLAWKLAAVIQGGSPALLDTYDEERGKVGEALLATTSRFLAAATTPNPTLESIRDHVMHWLSGLPYAQEKVRGFVSETAINYRHSSLVRDCGGASMLRAGDRAPDATYNDANGQERRLYEALAAPQHTLLLLHFSEKQRSQLTDVWPETQILALHPYPDEELARVYAASGEPLAYAIRPDGYIGFRSGLQDIRYLPEYAARIGVRLQTMVAQKANQAAIPT
jgi:2-polyprenyl-6-methoxyphenol hydroxylase-like FAD-dependent oxidoreductase